MNVYASKDFRIVQAYMQSRCTARRTRRRVPGERNTNVDFNAGMISALGSISKQEKVVMSVGPKEVGLYNKGEKVIERKVPLP